MGPRGYITERGSFHFTFDRVATLGADAIRYLAPTVGTCRSFRCLGLFYWFLCFYHGSPPCIHSTTLLIAKQEEHEPPCEHDHRCPGDCRPDPQHPLDEWIEGIQEIRELVHPRLQGVHPRGTLYASPLLDRTHWHTRK
jgi:hypothetical protein